eukprot:NODE_127_length_17034_cov_0.369590.p17 type:complete len:112 gc:universal NODE_127_length_17034_cov_0.369590:14220-13885(-)
MKLPSAKQVRLVILLISMTIFTLIWSQIYRNPLLTIMIASGCVSFGALCVYFNHKADMDKQRNINLLRHRMRRSETPIPLNAFLEESRNEYSENAVLNRNDDIVEIVSGIE